MLSNPADNPTSRSAMGYLHRDSGPPALLLIFLGPHFNFRPIERVETLIIL